MVSPRRFHLQREEDESGVSGVGRVAEGVEFSDGWVVLNWQTHDFSTGVGVYPGIRVIELIHGHNGKTKVVWDDA